jgi:type VI protein secretion system component VasK
MVLLGVILVLLAAAAGVLLVVGTAQITDTVDITMLGGTLSLPPLTLLITGMVVISLFWLGWAMLRSGLRRGKRRRVEAKEAAASAEARRAEDERRMQDEFAARERQLVEERRQREQETSRVGTETDSAHLTRTGDTVVDGRSAAGVRDTRLGETRPVDHPDTRG